MRNALLILMLTRTCLAVALGALLLIMAPRQAHCAPITFQFSGTVSEINDGALVPGVAVGASFSGVYTFDSSWLDRNPACQGWRSIGDFQRQLTCRL